MSVFKEGRVGSRGGVAMTPFILYRRPLAWFTSAKVGKPWTQAEFEQLQKDLRAWGEKR